MLLKIRINKTDNKLKFQKIFLPDAKSWLIGKDLDAWKD